ncbi:hypothetical protein H310_11723 [Aphanomyces invadans]|uniref:Uncharacterized protein n=1 Tax=Aphanomyces invadans TaxID=157072 RepID=A0A024TN27_9STRA|nr:hypothetical protein H310_11723 [Aphanomyces invadans]ETV94767.1 hypothetical protein H310_11723 [Aphanomyces invadans]|eukprot:XP_008876712.1 hypothetical protein H310_11723 [Aphanomyces invadans]
MPRYVVYFYHRYLAFRFAEFDAVLKIQGIHDPSSVYVRPSEAHDEATTQSPFLQLTLPSNEVAAAVAARCVLVKGIYRYIASGSTYDELLQHAMTETPLHPVDGTWSLWVDCFGLRLSLQGQDQRRHRITSVLDFPGNVQLKNAQFIYWLFEDKGVLPTEIAVKQVIFAREITPVDSHVTTRHWIDKHRLKKRKFIGPTSMDHELSLLMANLALVVPSTFVCDPFVGTASVLVACAQFGAMCIGGDIDPQPLHGTRPGLNIAANFAQYGLPVPDLLRWDVAHPPLNCRLRNPTLQFDAIVCDPPYGMRESAQSTSIDQGKVTALPPHAVIPPLLSFAATHLFPRGRLVYVMACQKREEHDYADHVPTNPLLRLLHVCVQEMTRKWVRLFIVMERADSDDLDQLKDLEESHARTASTSSVVLEDVRGRIRRTCAPSCAQ